ncbi:MAG: hypothetical protein NC300_01900 [Bacteroidales bacterium]|nr:hypothetical protein [Clostridium sp.]MCM1202878.1 hypothetical protein [Bacteroidales bacterium]
MMKMKKTCAVTLSAAMVLGMAAGSGSVSYAAGNIEKEETVYVAQESDGRVENITVSDWLKNVSGSGDISDVSNLEDIKNVKGDETFTQGSNGALTWAAKDADIYYQGTSNEKLPVGVDISYQLDGKSMKPEEMAGKSGKVTITIQYKNMSTFEEEINGQATKLTTPFLMASAMILPVDTFSNVTVSQGKLVSEGANQILVGYGMPGLSESLNLSKDMAEEMDKKLSDTVTVTADVTDFSMGSIYTVATSEEFSDIHLDDESDIQDVEKAINDLADASDELLAGSEDLSEGITTLQNSFTTYAAGVNEVSSGAADLSTGAEKLAEGVSQYTKGVTKVTTGASQYVTGTQSLAKGVDAYVDGEKKIDGGVTTLYDSAKDFPASYSRFSQGLLSYVDNVNKLLGQENTKQLADGSLQVAGGIGQINAGLTEINGGFVNYDTAVALLEQVQSDSKYAELDSASQAALATAIQLVAGTKGQQAAGVGALMAQTGADSALYQGANQIAGTMKQLNEEAAPALAAGGQQLKTGDKQISEGINGVVGGIKSVYDGVKTLSQNNKKLKAAAKTLTTKGIDLTAGVGQLTESTKTLTTSADTLSVGAQKLSGGAQKLNGATTEVGNGVSRLQSGSVDLMDGMRQFKAEGTGKLQNEYNDKVKTVLERFKAVTKGADSYKTFSGIADGMDGKVKFIFQTAEISNEKE